MSRVGSCPCGLAALLSGALALPVPVQAAPAADSVAPAVLAGEAQREFQAARAAATRDPRAAAGRYAAAGFLYARAAAALPEVEVQRETRADLLGQAGSAYLEAHRLAPDDPTPLRAARALATTHVAGLKASYGPEASDLAAYARAEGLIREVDALLGEPATAPATTAAPPPTPRRRADWRRVGLVSSLVLAGVSAGAALGTTFAVTRRPFTGPVYDEIFEAADDAGLAHMNGDDMCTLGRDMGVDTVVAACDTRDRVWRAAVAMMVVSGVSVIAAITFGALLARTRRPALARMRHHQAGVAVAPVGGGWVIGGGARF